LASAAEAILARLRETTAGTPGGLDRAPVAGRDAVEMGAAQFAQTFDRRHGGFGGAPKFPRPSELLFLLQAFKLTGEIETRRQALDTLSAMALGGLRDHVGGGFHRYSVDAEWRVPHFEKMLYDQAQLVLAYLEAAQASGDLFYSAVAEDTLDYVRRDLTSPEGACYSAEDADSEEIDVAAAGHKREGAFYVWTAAEIDGLLGADSAIARRRFGIEDEGNALADPQGEFRGKNILFVSQSIEDVATRSGREPEAIMASLTRIRQTLFDARAARPRPHLDDKVITAWNGLMIAAYARAARVLVGSPRREEWRHAALRAATAVRTHLWRAGDLRLWRRYRDGDAAVEGFCEDYACLVWGLLELVQATGDMAWLTWARELTDVQIELFYDPQDGGWYSTMADRDDVLLRLKEDYDGAEPAAASVTVRNLMTLGQLTGDRRLTDIAGRSLERYGTQIGRVARVMPLMVANVACWNALKSQIVLVGTTGKSDVDALEAEVARNYLPFTVVLPVDPSEPSEERRSLLPWVAEMTLRDGHATAYVCRDFTCQEPVTEAKALAAQLE
jgi:uncharacterized protein YyaL (SSP411 family)